MPGPTIRQPKMSPGRTVEKQRIVILSSDATLGLSLSLFLENVYRVSSTSEEEMVTKALESGMVDLLIIDIGLFDTGLLDLVGSVHAIQPDLPVIVMYVYQEKMRQLEDRLRTRVSMIFYKPVDLAQVSGEIRVLLAR